MSTAALHTNKPAAVRSPSFSPLAQPAASALLSKLTVGRKQPRVWRRLRLVGCCQVLFWTFFISWVGFRLVLQMKGGSGWEDNVSLLVGRQSPPTACGNESGTESGWCIMPRAVTAMGGVTLVRHQTPLSLNHFQFTWFIQIFLFNISWIWICVACTQFE